MVAPEHLIQDFIRDAKSGSIKDLNGVSSGLERIHASYDSYAWDWTVKLLADLYDVDVTKIDSGQLIELISKWESESIRLDKMILNDASKEYDSNSKIGFGIDGDEAVVNQDFEAVRGIPDQNKFIVGINKEMEQIEKKAAELKSLLSGI